jgi:hypothetical protein
LKKNKQRKADEYHGDIPRCSALFPEQSGRASKTDKHRVVSKKNRKIDPETSGARLNTEAHPEMLY